MDLRRLFGEPGLQDDDAETVSSPDMSEFGLNPVPDHSEIAPFLEGSGPPPYPDMGEFGVSPDPLIQVTGEGRPKYPSFNNDLADRWIVVRVDSSTSPVKPGPRWAFKDTGPKSSFGLMPADEADRWAEWYGPYSYKVAQDVMKDLCLVREIMDR